MVVQTDGIELSNVVGISNPSTGKNDGTGTRLSLLMLEIMQTLVMVLLISSKDGKWLNSGNRWHK